MERGHEDIIVQQQYVNTRFLLFYLGYADNEIACVKFGLITDETDVHELIGMVQETGKQVEEASKVSCASPQLSHTQTQQCDVKLNNMYT
jgi:hypothetical protein